MASYCPISQKVFGAVQIGRSVRIQLFFSLIVSRLVYCVHTWGEVCSSAYRRLNSVYMRGLRRICGACRYDAESARAYTDRQVRELLGVMSLQCLLARRRLLLLSQVVRHGGRQLLAMLAVRGNDGSRLQWTRQVIADMQLLRENCGGKLDDLGDPTVASEAWAEFIRKYPKEWALHVRSLRLFEMPADTKTSQASKCKNAPVQVKGQHHTYEECSSSFNTFKDLRMRINPSTLWSNVYPRTL